MKQQNKFCGVVFKKRANHYLLPAGYIEIQELCFVKSEMEVLFDGYRAGKDGSWCEALVFEHQIVLSRDRIGGRWIYYFENDEVFCFSNTIKQLLDLEFVPFNVSSQGAFDFLFFGKVGNMIEGVFSLKANHKLSFNLQSFETKIERIEVEESGPEVKDEVEASAGVRSAILDGVGEVIGGSEHLAALLSGGIDSSVIACAIALENEERNLPFITAMSEDEKLNELEFAESIIGHLKIPTWHQVMAQNIDKEVENLHLAMEFPTTSLGSFLQYEIMRFCKHQGIKEFIDGTGADALYAGHPYYHAIYWNELLRKGLLLKAIKAAVASGVASHNFRYYWKNILKYYYVPRLPLAAKLRFYMGNNALLRGLNSDFVRKNCDGLGKKPVINLRRVNRYLAHDFLGGGVEDLLRFNDRIGKYFGVMNRSIFTEFPAIYSYAMRISSDLKFKDGFSKYILRNAFADCLPSKVLQRKDKMGLVAPNNYWMKKHKALFLSYFTDDLSLFFNVKKMKNLLEKEIDEGGEEENYKVFRFISFAIWYKVMKK